MTSANASTRRTSRQRLLDTAAALFYSRGINVTGIDTVIAEAGVAKGSMYHHFAGKEALIAAYLDAEATSWVARVAAADDPTLPSSARVAHLFTSVADQVDTGRFYGCPFTNAAIECPAMPDVQAAIGRYRIALRERMSALLDDRGDESLITRLIVMYDGALTSAKLTRTSAEVRVVSDFAARVVTRELE